MEIYFCSRSRDLIRISDAVEDYKLRLSLKFKIKQNYSLLKLPTTHYSDFSLLTYQLLNTQIYYASNIKYSLSQISQYVATNHVTCQLLTNRYSCFSLLIDPPNY